MSHSQQDSLRRMVQSSVRMHTLPDSTALAQFVLDEFSALCTAQRAALVLIDESGDYRWTQISGGATIADLVPLASGVLNIAGTTRRPAFQPTRLAVPLISEERLAGFLYGDTIALASLDEETSDLLQLLADQAAVALHKIQYHTELTRQLAVRTAELDAATTAVEQRTAELAIINTLSKAIAGQFDPVQLVQLMGEQLLATFQADSVYVALVDTETGMITFPYAYGSVIEAHPFGGGVTSQVIITGQPLLINHDLDAYRKEYGSQALDTRARAYLGVPITVGTTSIGVVGIQSLQQTGAFNESDVRVLSTLAATVGTAIQNTRLYAANQRRENEAVAIASLSHEITATLDLPTVLNKIAVAANDLLAADSAAVYLLEPGSEILRAIVEQGAMTEELLDHTIALGEDIIGDIALRYAAEFVNDCRNDPRTRLLDGASHTAEPERLMAVSLLAGNTLVGVIAVWRTAGKPFTYTDLAFLASLARQAAIAIENAQLFAEIQRQKRFSEALIEASPVAIVQVDLGMHVTAWNPAAETLFGYSAAEAIGQHLDDLVANRPDVHQDASRYTTNTFGYSGKADHVIARRTRKDGQLVDVEFFGQGIHVDSKYVAGLVIYHDITELNRARQEAIAANEAKSAFLATMSHEIRTPMNGIIGMTGLLLGTELTPDQREFAETIRSSGDALLTIINDILDFSKIESGRLELETQPFDLRDCVESALDLIAPKAAEKNLDLAYTIDPDVPPALVGDVTRLRQILLNLLSNAVKFTENGEVVVTVTTDERLKTNAEGPQAPSVVGRQSSVLFSVRDTGIGIPEEGLGRLFRSFTQVDASTTRKYGGTGLGLAISRRLTELMDGQMWVESKVGVGTTFFFTITAPAAPPLKPRPHLEQGTPNLEGKRVLIVDDNATNRRIVSLQLMRWGMQVRDTALPHEALAMVQSGEKFDLAVLDMMMPEMDGLMLASALRKLLPAHQLPLMLWSSLGQRETGSPGLFAAQLFKPLKPSQLFDALMALFADGPTKVAAKAALPPPTADPTMATTHPLRILLAEDNVVNQKLALRLLGQMGYQADLASNGLEAVAAVERQAYDLVLMDVQMPELDGLDATRRIRSLALTAGQPRIIAMTANAMQGDRELCIDAGMDDYIAKPIKVAELIGALERTAIWRLTAS